MDRRKFLKVTAAISALGGVAGQANAGLARSTEDFSQSFDSIRRDRIKRTKVLIIGGGVAGLTAGYELKKLGNQDFVILEARSKVGGRVETIRSGDIVEESNDHQTCLFDRDKELYFNTGAARISHNHRGVLSYCRELGVPLELISNDNRNAYFVSSMLQNKRVTIGNLQASLRGHLSEFMAKSVLAGGIPELMTNDEIVGYLTALTVFGDLDSNFEFKQSTRVGIEAGSGALSAPIPISPTDMSEIAKLDAFSQYKLHLSEVLDQQSSMMQPIGGMDKIVTALHQELRRHVRLNTEVISIRRNDGSAIVTCRRMGKTFEMIADKVIVAAPPHIAASMDHDFSSDVAGSLASYQLSKAAKVAFQSNRFWEHNDQIFGGISYTDKDITLMWYPSNNLGKQQGVLVGAYNVGVDSLETFGELSSYQRIQLALEQGEDLHPGYSGWVDRGITRSWLQTPHIKGGWSISPPQERLLQRDGPYIFAGDYVSQKSGWMEGAIASAQHAVSLIAD